MNLEAGNTAAIYVGPLTKDGYEGDAKLIHKFSECGDLEQWSVEFEDSQGNVFNRWIMK